MAIKSPRKRALGKRQFQARKTLLRVHVQKLDENVFEAYKNRLIGTYGNPASVKEERACIFSSEIDLSDNEHNPANESSGPCQCSYCSPYREMKLQSYKQYLDPAEDQENVGHRYPYLCDLVQENVPEFSAPQQCDAETQTAPRQYKYTCKDCFCQFNDQYYYEHHVTLHSRRLYECAFCNATYTNDKQLQTHILMHKHKNCYECVECSCVFANKKHLIKHMRSHNKNFFECVECKAQFNTDKGLQNHKKTHASSGKMIHVFRLAKTAQSQPTNTVVVMETACTVYEEPPVNAPRFFECNVCHLQFPNAGALTRHNSIHNRSAAKFLHFCNVCGARFRANSHLTSHKRFAHKL